jgi:hypothetical protein
MAPLGLLRHTRRFPKQMRHSCLETAAFEFEEALPMANAARGPERGVGRKSRISTDLYQFSRLKSLKEKCSGTLIYTNLR